jgi:hypothetical protein
LNPHHGLEQLPKNSQGCFAELLINIQFMLDFQETLFVVIFSSGLTRLISRTPILPQRWWYCKSFFSYGGRQRQRVFLRA